MIPFATGPRFDRSKAGMWLVSLALTLLFGLTMTSAAKAYAVPSDESARAIAPVSRSIRLAQAQPSPAPSPAAPSAQPAASSEPIGNVATLTGTASVIRNQNTLPLKLKDDIYLNDKLVTFSGSTLGITFNDETTFNLNANTSITVDNYVYEEGGQQNSALFDVARGTAAFVASAVARTGNMKITTPTATLGIRGTSGLVEVDGAGAGAHNIKLYPDPDGHVGTIDVSDRNGGARLGTLTQGASGFTVRPGAGGRITASALVISPQQAARDQGIVRQAHAAQAVGRQVVSEQRALRRANPSNPRGAPGQNGPQRQNNLQQRPGGRELQNSPNRNGQPGQPGQPNRATQQAPQPPAAQAPGAQRPTAPELRQGGAPNRPAAVRKPPPPRKPPKEKRR
jgi:FecR-like protein